jgi:hypothetical protein
MTEHSSGRSPIRVLPADLQIEFWARLQVLRKEYLADSLATAVASADILEVDRELGELVGPERLAALASHGLRGEAVFPVPSLLRIRPMLLGYYRLLFGISQKEFYGKGPFGRFRAMEETNRLAKPVDLQLPDLCRSLISTGWQLFTGIEPPTLSAIHELQLLTIGPQLRGLQNNRIGQDATSAVFALVRDIVGLYIASSTERTITVKNSSGRTVCIAFAADPDIAIVETMPTDTVPSVSIEIKGGADVSNVHNRIGEAEKSHQKARAARFTQFWTITRAKIDPQMARRESPTTTHFFNLGEIVDKSSDAHQRFRDLLFHAVGIA